MHLKTKLLIGLCGYFTLCIISDVIPNSRLRQFNITGAYLMCLSVDKAGPMYGWSNEETIVYNNKQISTDFENFYRKETKPLNDSLLQRHEFKNLIDSEVCEEKPELLIFIMSAVSFTERRDIIRSTYASITSYFNFSIKHLFVLGQRTNNDRHEDIVKESEKYQDIIQGNFEDTYKNLSYKLTYYLNWIDTHCRAKHIVSVDDDIMINIPLLVNFLLNSPEKLRSNHMLCEPLWDNVPTRDRWNKFFVSTKEYEPKNYPPYCTGPVVIMSPDVPKKLLAASKYVPFYWISDVYAYGFMPWIARVQISQPRNILLTLFERQMKNFKKNYMFFMFPNQVFYGKNSRTAWENTWKQLI